jgi:hypothetical protein
MTPVDQDAMRRAIAAARAQGPGRDEQIAHMLATCPWEEVGRFAAYSSQYRALRLRPWEFPPCWMENERPLDDPNCHGLFAAWRLRMRLIEAGLSQWEPDPITALAAATKPAA